MSFGKKTVRDLDVGGKRVLVRVDFNVPLKNEGGGVEVADDLRLTAALPTIDYLRDRGARLVLVSHLGRPRDREPELSMAPVSKRLAELVDAPVTQAPGVVGDEVTRLAGALASGEVLVLENSRFEPGEKQNDPQLARELADLADLYVDDAFGAAHRAHATTVGVAELLPAVAGFLLEKEVLTLTSLLESPARPLVVVLGGVKVSDKVGVIDRFLDVADAILVGGAMCFSFFSAQGIPTGDSLVDDESVAAAKAILARAGSAKARLFLPEDLVVAEKLDASAEPRTVEGTAVPAGTMGLDIGPATAKRYAAEIVAARTVFWNGPMGAFELPPFAAGTKAVAVAMAESRGTTVVGGGDSAAAIDALGLADRMTHVSTGGGASLELIEGKPLPGVEVLDDA